MISRRLLGARLFLSGLRTSSSSSSSYDDQVNLWNDFNKYYQQNLNKYSHDQQLTHIDQATQKPKQVDVGHKQPSVRIACASGYLQLNETAFDALVGNRLRKGNALIVSQLAGIQASKLTAQLIPLCHHVPLDVCDVELRCERDTRRVHCEATCKTSMSKTGVEMEALTACTVALLTVYDMCKAVQKDACIREVRLEYKTGGKSDFKNQL